MTPVPVSTMLVALGFPAPVAEYRFAPPRRWRFDFAWPDQRVALEIQGGLFSRGRHVRGAALLKEHEKLNESAALGWRVVFATPQNVYEPHVLSRLRRALEDAHD